ncbi:MDR family MFS transporter [Sinomonas cellulolyticus]|uniref:MFS transporter n=1 Tax=Sinomonas cellulolyticus TaxID=2801916 RepID=A0ABS1JXS7_9MICC|nr:MULTISPECIES: MDR family MFS transporter [Sinomonas]MBL0704179.1 MFS transporter [Sinomonas cellulolyticus]
MSHKQILEALTGLLAAFFTAILSSTIVANALPTIMADLKGTQTDFAWVITAALLANAVTTPIWGKLSDLFDKKFLTQLNIVVFVAGSVLAGFAQNIPWLIGARVIQGVAMGGLTAMAMAIIGTMIPPRDRGKYNGYMGAVMAVGTAGGPLLGGFIVDSPLGWRWTFFVCVPLAVVALILIQVTLKIKHVKRVAKIDWLGSILLTASVSTLLIWVSFAGKADYYDWWSWQTAAMVGGSVLGLILLVIVESRVAMPIIPLKIVANRTTALSIVASGAVGVAMFASSSYLGQYFQVARGATPTEAGLLTLPMIAGNFLGSVVSGQLISRYGKWKRFLILGAVLTIVGLGMLGTIDHSTDLLLAGVYTFVLGTGLGMTMQNLVLGVQNTVRASDIGTASSTVAFFRSVFGAIGVSVLGAVLSNRSSDLVVQGLADHGIKAPAGSAGGSMDLKDMPAPIADIVRGAFGDATAEVFLIAAVIAVASLLAVLFIKEVPLRRTVDIVKPAQEAAGAAPVAAAPAAVAAPVAQLAAEPPAHDGASSPEASGSPSSAPSQAALRHAAIREALAGPEHGSELDSELQLLLADAESRQAAAPVEAPSLAVLQETQRLLAAQQVQLGQLFSRVADQLEVQQRIAAEQSRTAKAQAETAAGLAAIQAELAAERELQKEAALYLATRGRHTAS